MIHTTGQGTDADDILEITVDPDYVPWKTWESVRELMQNAVDAHEDGFKMDVSYNAAKSQLEISNAGAHLSRATLVLGKTDKKGSTTKRGKFGEGYKLACLSLVRKKHFVSILNGHEIWYPFLHKSTKFDTEVLGIKVVSNPDPFPGVKFIVDNITEDEYKIVCGRLLFVKPPKKALETERGSVILDKDKQNKLYIRGIYIAEMPDRCQFSYDLKYAETDRDRKMAEPNSLKTEIATVFADAVKSGKLDVAQAYKILNNEDAGFFTSEWGESRALSDYPWHDGFNQLIVDYFKNKYGKGYVPVSSRSEALESEHYGFRGILCSSAITKIYNEVEDSFKELASKESVIPNKIYSLDELTKVENQNLTWAINLFKTIHRTNFDVEVVDFKNTSTLGLWERKRLVNDLIRLSKTIVSNRAVLISVLIHEVAHQNGLDGTSDHRREIERLSGLIIDRNVK